MRSTICALLVLLGPLSLVSCVTSSDDDNEPVPPPSSGNSMPWNRPRPGEGQAQFGGMLERR